MGGVGRRNRRNFVGATMATYAEIKNRTPKVTLNAPPTTTTRTAELTAEQHERVETIWREAFNQPAPATNGTVQELIARVIPRESWAAQVFQDGMVCLSTPTRPAYQVR